MTRGCAHHEARHRRGARALAILAAAASSAVAAAPAPAQGPLPDDNAGTGQYVEPVPDAGGDRPAAPGSRDGAGRLPSDTREALPPGEEGRILERIASEPGTGAPDDKSANDTQRGKGGSGGGTLGATETDEGAMSALTSAVADSDSPALPLILLAILGMTAAAILVRRRRGS
jgi:hypothetical protein